MNVWTRAFVSLVSVVFQLIPLSASAASLQYEPAVVELRGIVALEQHFGPPCYGESPQTDSVELIAVILLDEPVSVEGDADPQSLNGTSYTDVRKLQLVRGYSDLPFSPYAGKHVVVSGTLYEGFTGHHHTDVLIRVETIAVR